MGLLLTCSVSRLVSCASLRQSALIKDGSLLMSNSFRRGSAASSSTRNASEDKGRLQTKYRQQASDALAGYVLLLPSNLIPLPRNKQKYLELV